MTNPFVAEVFYININNGQMPRERLSEYINRVLPSLFAGIRVPVNIAIPAFDWVLIKLLNPQLFHRVATDPNLHVLFTTFTHFMPLLFPNNDGELLLDQLKISEAIYNKVIQLSYTPVVAMLGEFSAYDSVLSILGSKVEAVIINEQFQDVLGATQYESYLYHFPQYDMLALSSDYKAHYRDNILGMYREEITPKETVKKLKEKAFKERHKGLLTVVCDFEVPYHNRPYLGEIPVASDRVDLFEEYQREAQISGIEFVHLSSKQITLLTPLALSRPNLHLMPRRVSKWQLCSEAVELREEVQQEVSRCPLASRSTYSRLLLNLACSADAYSSFAYLGDRGLEIPSRFHGKAGYRIIVTGNAARADEIRHFLHCIREESPVNRNVPPAISKFQWFYDAIDSALQCVSSSLKS